MASDDNAALDCSKPTILVVDTGLDARLIDAVHRRYDPPHGKGVNIVAIATAPSDWDEKNFSALTDPRHLNNANQWLFDKSKVNHLIVAKADPKLGYPSIKQLADEINALDLDIKGILSHPYNAFIDLEMAELCEQVHGLERYPTLEQVSVFKDKPTANAFLRKLNEEYDIEKLLTPWDATIESADGGELQSLEELKWVVWKKIHDYTEAQIAENETADWEIIVKGKPVKVSSDDPSLDLALRKHVSKAIAAEAAKSVPWKLFLKPVAGDGSLGVVELNSELSAQEMDERLEHHWKELQATRTKKSILQEFVGDMEIGYHGYKNGSHIHHEITIKDMYGSKEIAHTDSGRHRSCLQKRWEKAIFPVMEKIFEELKIDIGQLNADIRMNEWKADFCPVDLQVRSGFGHPEMKNAVYGTDADMKKPLRGRDVEQLFVAMGLDMGEEDVKEAVGALQKLKPKRAAIAATIIPEGGHFLLSNITDARLEAAKNMPGIIDFSVPDLNAGDQIHEIKSLPTTEGHIFIAASGKDLCEARENANHALAMAGVAIIRPGDRAITDRISTIFNSSATGRAQKGQISPFTITTEGATEAEVAAIANTLNYDGDESALDKKLRDVTSSLAHISSGQIETPNGLKETIAEVEERRAKKYNSISTHALEVAAIDAYQRAVAAGFSETERTHHQWNGIVPSYTLIEPQQPATGTRWHNGAKGPEALFKAREERLARRRRADTEIKNNPAHHKLPKPKFVWPADPH